MTTNMIETRDDSASRGWGVMKGFILEKSEYSQRNRVYEMLTKIQGMRTKDAQLKK